MFFVKLVLIFFLNAITVISNGLTFRLYVDVNDVMSSNIPVFISSNASSHLCSTGDGAVSDFMAHLFFISFSLCVFVLVLTLYLNVGSLLSLSFLS